MLRAPSFCCVCAVTRRPEIKAFKSRAFDMLSNRRRILHKLLYLFSRGELVTAFFKIPLSDPQSYLLTPFFWRSQVIDSTSFWPIR